MMMFTYIEYSMKFTIKYGSYVQTNQNIKNICKKYIHVFSIYKETVYITQERMMFTNTDNNEGYYKIYSLYVYTWKA
jgi:hypothetical protein